MKKMIITTIIATSTLFFVGCGGSEETSIQKNEVVAEKETVQENNNVIIKTVSYVGTLDDINIHMTLDYYDNNSVEGIYYYDKYNKEIQLSGEILGEDITLKTADESEEFVGRLLKDRIIGEWKSGDKTRQFNVKEDKETYGKARENNIVKDDDYIYYIGGNSYEIFRCKLDSTENTKLAESGSSYNIDIANNKIYYLNEELKLCRMDKNGENQEILLDKAGSISRFIVYKDRIYFDNSSDRDLDNEIPFKLLSIDLDGNDYKEVLLPEYPTSNNENVSKSYFMSYIYKDYVYFTSREDGADVDIYRIKTDGTDPKPIGGLGYVVGCAYDDFYYQGVNTSVIYKQEIEGEADGDEENIFNGTDSSKNENGEYENYTMNDSYIVYNYTTSNDDYHYITVVDLSGNIVNEIQLNKEPASYEGPTEYVMPVIINDYIYFTLSVEYTYGYLARVKILGDEVEVLVNY